MRIEDTDRKRSTKESVDAIREGLEWLGLDWEGDAVSQFSKASHHAEIARQLLVENKAYNCYCTPEELQEMRNAARKKGTAKLYEGRCRDRDPASAPKRIKPAIRLKVPLSGETVIEDLVQGEVTVANDQLDDMILLRADGTPTYMLAVVVDDHDMGVTHIIRGDDHLTNAFRQTQLYGALGWETPAFAHIPLIHGPDGTKLSKRHGALGIDAYRDAGFLPEALCNYLLRLGWSHGDDEIISRDQAIEWFGLNAVGRSPSRFDIDKLNNVDGHYIRHAEDERLAELVIPRLRALLDGKLADEAESRLTRGMPGLKGRAKTLVELAKSAQFYVQARPLALDEKAARILEDGGRKHLKQLSDRLADLSGWTQKDLEDATRGYVEAHDIKLGKATQPLRAALTGGTVSPGIFEVMEILGREETLARLEDVLTGLK